MRQEDKNILYSLTPVLLSCESAKIDPNLYFILISERETKIVTCEIPRFMQNQGLCILSEVVYYSL